MEEQIAMLEEKTATLHHSRRMKNKPPLPPEDTPGHCYKHNKMQAT